MYHWRWGVCVSAGSVFRAQQTHANTSHSTIMVCLFAAAWQTAIANHNALALANPIQQSNSRNSSSGSIKYIYGVVWGRKMEFTATGTFGWCLKILNTSHTHTAYTASRAHTHIRQIALGTENEATKNRRNSSGADTIFSSSSAFAFVCFFFFCKSFFGVFK